MPARQPALPDTLLHEVNWRNLDTGIRWLLCRKLAFRTFMFYPAMYYDLLGTRASAVPAERECRWGLMPLRALAVAPRQRP